MDTPPSPGLQSNHSTRPGGETEALSSGTMLPPWDTYTVAVSLVTGYLLIPLLVSQVIILINPFLSEPWQLFIQQIATLFTWISIFAVLQWKYGRLKEYLGLEFSRPLKYYAWETVKLILLTTALTLLLSKLWEIFAPKGKMPYADFSSAQLVVLTIFAVVMAPVLEELIFRGLVQSTFHKCFKPLGSVFMTTLVFLLLHGSYYDNLQALVFVLVLGLCFGIWRERTQSLLPGMMAHLFNNGLASLMLLMSVKH